MELKHIEVKHYVEYGLGGRLFTEYQDPKTVKTKDVKTLRLPKDTVKIKYYDVIEAQVEHEGEMVPVKSGHLNEKVLYVGTFLSIADLEAMDMSPDYIDSLERDGAIGVVITPIRTHITIYDEAELKNVISPKELTYETPEQTQDLC